MTSSPESWREHPLLPLALLAALGGLLYALGPVLMPFAVSGGLAYLGDPLVDRLETLRFKRVRLSRTAAVCAVFAVIFGVGVLGLALLVPRLIEQATAFVHALPDWLNWLQVQLAALGVPVSTFDADTLRKLLIQNWTQAGSGVAAVLAPVTQSGLTLLGFFANLVLIPVVTFYLLRDWDVLMQRLHGLIPANLRLSVTTFAREADSVLGAFLRGQLLVMTALSIFYMLGLWMAGLQLAVLIGLLAGLVSFVPYLGVIVGAGAASIAVLVQTPELAALLPVLVVFGVGQLLEGMVLTPWLVGDRIGLHPVAVIFAVMAGGQLFGLTGVLLALPAAAVIVVALRHLATRPP